jgi:hypothetical protein
MIKPGDIVSYFDMCKEEGTNLQRGMYFRLHRKQSIFLMSVRKGAPYEDRIQENGKVLIYEGHDISQDEDGPDPKTVDQPWERPNERPTQNAQFYQAVEQYKNKKAPAEVVKVYEKIYSGIWSYNGRFRLIDAWQEDQNNRKVFKFKLELIDEDEAKQNLPQKPIEHERIIPSSVKLQVWKRDKGQCRKCGSKENLHFDHIIPYSKGGSSLVVENIQLLCAKHNLEKRDRIE